MTEAIWWQRGIVYQIYPRSFQDTDADGIGDLRGIIGRLDYLVALGVDAIWLSPIFPSPMADFGYDVACYTAIDPIFGTLADFDALVAAVHARGLRLILDYVPNHSSDQHPWFLDSRNGRNSAKRDWYLWHDPAPGGGPPNNWLSHFGGSAWQWDAASGQYYYHAFLPQQPDLNWRNPEVRRAMLDVLRFWLDRGVDGFRVDVMWLLIKDDRWRDNPVNPAWLPGQRSHDRLLPVYTADRPEVHAVVAAMRQVTDAYADRLLIGEIYLPIERLVTYYGQDEPGAQLPFNFQLLLTDWTADAVARVITDYEKALPDGGWPNWVLGNHDRPRLASRAGPEQTRVAAMLLLTLRGTPTIYYGEEIGMTDVPIAPDQVQDPAEHDQPGLGLGRDPVRTPMPWDPSPLAGFTNGLPWLPLGDDHTVRNVALQRDDNTSLWHFYRTLITLRRTHPSLTEGSITGVTSKASVLHYQRVLGNERLAIALNFGTVSQAVYTGPGRILLSASTNHSDVGSPGILELGGGDGVIVRLDAG
jgi:alpha-glucosidase